MVLECGPHNEYVIQQTECPRCRWHAVGKLFALIIAENAHQCGFEDKAPATQPDTSAAD